LPQLVVLQVLGAIGGAALGFPTALVAVAIVAVIRRLFRPAPEIDGLFIGGATGLVGGLVVAPLPHLGAGFVASSAVACAICGFRAAQLHRRAVDRRTSA
jgi:hypothetical protein